MVIITKFAVFISHLRVPTDRFAWYNAFDAYHGKHDLPVMEKLLTGYINERLDGVEPLFLPVSG